MKNDSCIKLFLFSVSSADSSSLDSQFDQKSINELNEHLYDSFDTLPNLKTKVDAPDESDHQSYFGGHKRQTKYEDDNVIRPKHLILCCSNENLPFIDSDSPSCSHHTTHDRVIQMIPRNMLISSSTQRQNIITSEWEKLHQMQKNSPTHKFVEVDVMDAQICQKCHRYLSFKKTYKCSLCEYVCHQKCAATDKVSFFHELHSR